MKIKLVFFPIIILIMIKKIDAEMLFALRLNSSDSSTPNTNNDDGFAQICLFYLYIYICIYFIL